MLRPSLEEIDDFSKDEYSIENDAIVQNDVLTSLKERHSRAVIRIPSTIGGQRIRAIDCDPGIRNRFVKSLFDKMASIVVVEEGIEELDWYVFDSSHSVLYLPTTIKTIHARAFVDLNREMLLYVDRLLTRDEYDMVLCKSRKLADGRRLLLDPMNDIETMAVINDRILVKHPMPVMGGIDYNYILKNELVYDCPYGQYSRGDNRRYSFRLSETESIRAIDEFGEAFIRNLIKNTKSGSQEQVGDYAIPCRKLQPTTFISFDEDAVVESTQGVKVRFLYDCGDAYVPIMKPVMYRKNKYYVLCRIHFCADRRLPLTREAIDVYDENGRIVRDVRDNVIDKLNLPDCL